MEERLNNLTFGNSFLIGLVLTGIYYFSFYDTGAVLNNQISATKVEYDKSVQEIERIKKAVEDAERYKKTVAVLGTEMERILLAVPEKLTSIEFMQIVSTEAKKSGVAIINLSSQKGAVARKAKDSTEPDFYERVPVDVELSGKYQQLMIFLAALTHVDKIVTVGKIQMSLGSTAGKSSDANSPDVSLKATLSAYRYSPVSATDKKSIPRMNRGGEG